ncbi:MAG: hypothetical protein ACJ783_04985 [Myxococcales bacterium]
MTQNAARAWERFRFPAAVCALLLALGFARLVPGARIESAREYRVWSFGAFAYSDVIALHDDRGGGRHRVPYFEDRIEYPALLAAHMYWPSLLAPNRVGYFVLSYLALSLCALGTLLLLCGIEGTQPWAFAATPALTLYAGLNWDLFAIFPMTLGIVWWLRQRRLAGAAALAVGACTKVFPGLALGALLVREEPRRAIAPAALALAIAALVNAPFAILARRNWLWFFEYNSGRDNEPSLYTLFGAGKRDAIPLASGLLAASVLVCFLVFALSRRGLRVRAPIAAVMLVFFFFTRVWSPQYWLWIFAVLALAGAPAWIAAAASGAAVIDYIAAFGLLHLSAAGDYAQATWFYREVFIPDVAIRCAVLAGSAIWAFRRAFPSQARGPRV